MRVAKYAILTFPRLYPTAKPIHIKMDNIVALSYLVKMGGTQLLVLISKEIWEYLLEKGTTITAEYLPGALNKEAGMQSQTVKDSSKWKLNAVVFQNLCKSSWTPDIDLFRFQSFPSSSSLCLLETRSIQQRQGCSSNVLESHEMICFFPIFSNRQSLTQSFGRSSNANFDNTTWQTQSWYPQLLRLSMRNPLILPNVSDLLQGPKK